MLEIAGTPLVIGGIASAPLVILTSLFLGFRHGFDYDHMAAIMDITSTQSNTRRATLLGALYATGHGAVVMALGLSVALIGLTLPAGVDMVSPYFVGATLIVLGVYVLYSLAKHRGDENFRMTTRITLLANSVLYLYAMMRTKISGKHIIARKVFSQGYGSKSSIIVGSIHGIGAETPSQVAIFSVSLALSFTLGITALVLFIVGIMIANTVFGFATAVGYNRSLSRSIKIYKYVSFATAVISLAIGFVFLYNPDIMPDIVGGLTATE